VDEFENSVKAYLGCEAAIGVSSGTDALLISLMALGLKPGDGVLTTPFTFFATAGSIARLGLKPVFADIEPDTFNMSPGAAEEVLKKNKKVRAMMPVHLYGQCADMGRLMKLARKYRLPVIEDACQVFGSRVNAGGKSAMAGCIGATGCFSFFPSKNLGGFGDGGMIATNSKKLGDAARMLRVHGSRQRYMHDVVGINGRLDGLQAAVLSVKLKYVDVWNSMRREKAAKYNSLLKSGGLAGAVVTPSVAQGNLHIYHQYVIKAKDRDALKEHLKAAGVETQVYYPVPLHMQKCFKGLGYRKGSLPVTEAAAREVLALPIYAELKDEEIEFIAGEISRFYAGR
jgi:dTDP-4-amino-4,6-dideoxygalactose transaminase